MRIFFLAIVAVFAFTAGPAVAQYKPSGPEDVLIAFFKTGNTVPNYDKLAKASDDYLVTPVARQKKFLEKEKARLAAAYNNYDPQSDPIVIRTRVFLELFADVQEDDSVQHSMTLSFGKDDALYFPYDHAGYNIAIIPQKMDSSFVQNLEQSQYDLIKQSLRNNNKGEAVLFVQLRPSKAYLDEPYRIGGMDQWALVADVAGLIMTDKKGGRLWTYSAPWYVSPVTNELRTMYSTQTIEKQREMQEENPLAPIQ